MPASAEQWLAAEKQLLTLYPKLVARADDLRKLDDYYVGDHPLPFLTKAHAKKMRNAFRQMLEESRTNFMRLLVDVVDERLEVEGIRLSATSDPTSDKASWDIWQANQMDSLSRAGILESLIKGVAYVSVWPDSDGDGFADIAVEDACETYVSYTPGSNFRRRDAALKVWKDDVSGKERANVYTPDAVFKFERRLTKSQVYVPRASFDATKWMPIASDDAYVPHSLGVVPIVPLRNRGRLLVEGESEISDQLPVQNQINGFLFLLALAGYFGAHKQRWATGITLEEGDDGEIKEPFDVAIDKMFIEADEKAKFGEFTQTDLDGYLKAIEQKVQHLAITTRTPKHYLLPEGQDPSGDAIKSSESGLVRRVGRKQTALGESFEEIMRLARLAQEGAETPVDSEVVWAIASTESEAAVADATIKKYEAGLISKEQALEDLGYSQTQITRIMRAQAADALLKSLETPSEPEAPPEADEASEEEA